MAWREVSNIFDKKDDEVIIQISYSDNECFFDRRYFSTEDSLSELLHIATAMEGDTLECLHKTVNEALDSCKIRKGALIQMEAKPDLCINVYPAVYAPYIHPISGEA